MLKCNGNGLLYWSSSDNTLWHTCGWYGCGGREDFACLAADQECVNGGEP